MEVEEVDEPHETDNKDEVDEGLDREAEDPRTAVFLKSVGDPLVHGPKEEEKDEAGEPGADDAAGFDTVGIDVGVEEADTRHEEGAEKREEDLPAGGFVFGRGGRQ
jgi:hypothetical protein